MHVKPVTIVARILNCPIRVQRNPLLHMATPVPSIGFVRWHTHVSEHCENTTEAKFTAGPVLLSNRHTASSVHHNTPSSPGNEQRTSQTYTPHATTFLPLHGLMSRGAKRTQATSMGDTSSIFGCQRWAGLPHRVSNVLIALARSVWYLCICCSQLLGMREHHPTPVLEIKK